MYEDLTVNQKEVFLRFISALDTLGNRAAYANQYTTWSDRYARSEINTTIQKFKEDDIIKEQSSWDIMINLPIDYLVLLGFREWGKTDKNSLYCLPLWILSIMPDNIGFEGADIFGSKCFINNKIDNDTRGGLLAYGIVVNSKEKD